MKKHLPIWTAILILIVIHKQTIAQTDTIPPVITINGASPLYHILNFSYTDPGATAWDNNDGNITANITTNITGSNPDVNLKGTYIITYTVSDSAGNIGTANRTVYVYNQADTLSCVNYQGQDSCQISVNGPFISDIQSSNTINNRILIQNFSAFGSMIFIAADLTGTTVSSTFTFPPTQSLGGTAVLLSGSGSILSLTPIVLGYTFSWTDGTNSETCWGDYTSQCIVGLNDYISHNTISIFPNPFSTQTTLLSDNPFNNATLTVDNCFGQTVVQIKNINGQTIIFQRNNLPSGLYLLRLTEDSKVVATKKIIIAN